MLPPTPASALGHRYFPHIADVCAGIARVSAQHRLLSPLLVLVWHRLRRMIARLDRLADRWQRDRLRPYRPRIRKPYTPKPVHPAEAWLPRRTPRGHAWLIRLHQPLAQHASRIELILNDPDIISLCAAAPQAKKLLRPFCRMFGLTPPPHIAAPPRPRRPRPAKPPKPEPPPFAEHSPAQWPYVPTRLRLKVPGLHRRRRSKQAALF